MFQIAALIFSIVNGVPSAEPDGTILSRHHFETVEACQDFLVSDKGKVLQETITGNPEFQHTGSLVKFECRMTSDPGINPDSPPR